MSRLTFLHAADLYLDSPFTGLQHPRWVCLLSDPCFVAPTRTRSVAGFAMDHTQDYNFQSS